MIDSEQKVHKICDLIQRLEDADIAHVKILAQDQAHYTHPFKNASAAKISEIGRRNLRIIDLIEQLKAAVLAHEKK